MRRTPMKLLSGPGDVDHFFQGLGKSSRCALLLDYDGTLAPFEKDPAAARAYPGVMESLQRLSDQGRTRIVFVTGRRIHDLLPLLELSPIPEIWGAHGYEHCPAGGQPTERLLGRASQEGLDRLAAALEPAARGARTEIKPGSIAFHWRGRPASEIEEMRAELEAAWARWPERATLRMTPFDGGLEFRAFDRNKGTAVRDLLHAGERAAFLGDDQTDEDAFAALPEGSLAVLVRPEVRASVAHVWIRPPTELLQFLERWWQALASTPLEARTWT